MTTPALSLIVPLHDEAENVAPLVAACTKALAALALPCELILVDDGSRDATRRELTRLASDDHGGVTVRAIGLRRRFGKGAALAAGVRESRGARVAFIDADLQEDPAELPRLLSRLDDDGDGAGDVDGNGADLVQGWRRVRRDSASRRAQSGLFRALVRVLARSPIHDINCGFKVMRRELAEELDFTGGRFRFVPLFAEWWGYRVAEVEVTHRPRLHGRSSFGGGRFPRVVIDLIALLCLIRYHSRPGHLFIQSGTVSGLVGGGICAYLAYLRLADGTIGFRYPLLALGVLLLIVGVQLVATGFLGEWLAYRYRGAEPGYRIGWRLGWRLDDDGAPPTRGETR